MKKSNRWRTRQASNWRLPNGSKITGKSWRAYQKSLLRPKNCKACDDSKPEMEFVRNCKTGRLKSICAECFKAGKVPKTGINGRLFSSSRQPGTKIPPPKNQANRTKRNAELGGTFSTLPLNKKELERQTFGGLALTEAEAKLAGELLVKKRRKK